MQTSAPTIVAHGCYSGCLIFRRGYTQSITTNDMTFIACARGRVGEIEHSQIQGAIARSGPTPPEAMTYSISTAIMPCGTDTKIPPLPMPHFDGVQPIGSALFINAWPTLPSNTLYFDRISSFVRRTLAVRRGVSLNNHVASI